MLKEIRIAGSTTGMLVPFGPIEKAAKRGKPARVTGTIAFDRKEFGMDSGIPFIRIANRAEVTIDFKATRASGPPLLFKR